ncbi:MAG: hypothetical protein KJ737_12920 [Proteobacteria bacterium]|nr:hypothetical protein [Pseudomonadota bacterium]
MILVGNDFYIKIDNTYSLLSDAVIEHIGHLSEKQQTINFAWYQSGDDTYEIKFLFAKELSRGDCSRLVVMHDLKRRGLFVNNQNSKIDTIENEILVTNEMK